MNLRHTGAFRKLEDAVFDAHQEPFDLDATRVGDRQLQGPLKFRDGLEVSIHSRAEATSPRALSAALTIRSKRSDSAALKRSLPPLQRPHWDSEVMGELLVSDHKGVSEPQVGFCGQPGLKHVRRRGLTRIRRVAKDRHLAQNTRQLLRGNL
jgi:hypothetical protein